MPTDHFTPSATPSAPATTSLRVGVIGAGGMGTCHATNLDAHPSASVAWVADPDETTGKTLADRFAVPWIVQPSDGIDACDALVVASPDRFHAHGLNLALDHGYPVLCEKPLTDRRESAQEVVSREVGLGKRLIQTGFMRVYDHRHLQVRDALRPLGPITHVRAVHRNTAQPGGRTLSDILVQSIVHDFHTVRWLTGAEFVAVSTLSVERSSATEFVVISGQLSDGSVATIEFHDNAAGYEVSVEVDTEGGNVVMADAGNAAVKSQACVTTTIGTDWFAPFLDTYRDEVHHWVDSIIATSDFSGFEPVPTAWDGLVSQILVDASLESSLQGTPVEVALPERPELYRAA